MPRHNRREEKTQRYKQRGASSRKNDERRRKRFHETERYKREGGWKGRED